MFFGVAGVETLRSSPRCLGACRAYQIDLGVFFGISFEATFYLQVLSPLGEPENLLSILAPKTIYVHSPLLLPMLGHFYSL